MAERDTTTASADRSPGFAKKLANVARDYGPGIVMVLTMMGAGDLITSAVSGSNYGYNLMWLLVLSLMLRFVILNVMGRFQIYNSEGMTILEGYSRIHKIFPVFFGIAAICMGHLITAQMIKGSGIALAWMSGLDYPFVLSIVVVIASVILMRRNAYSSVEKMMKVLLGVLTFCFIGLAVYSGPDPVEILIGTVGFGFPDDTAAFDAFLVGIALVGSVAGSLTNLIYPYFLVDRGWVRPEHKRIQRNDLLFSFAAAIVIDLAIWVVGAEILRPNGIEVTDIGDIAQALMLYMGHLGAWIFYLGVFGILYSSVIGTANGYGKIIVDSYYQLANQAVKKTDNLDKDPKVFWMTMFLLFTPLVWSIPGVTGFVTLVLFTNALSILALPAIAVGLLIISNNKGYLADKTNNIVENVILVATTLLTLWGSYTLLVSFFD
ncbi:Nramp family divalent metal transporter [Salinicola halophilus]|uniref:Nramp family divalent metal transporter n=1 Tax=Salinicola halophilus TaxID=184065 RepID=UPI000DA2127E|nr:Nramp family divalent metal transporter [Salinicola halophilus]